MAFLTKAARGDDGENPEDGKEEMYMELFAKIGRDFVHREDLKAIMLELLIELGLEGLVNVENDTGARERAREYRAMQAQGRQGTDVYPDLIPADNSEQSDAV